MDPFLARKRSPETRQIIEILCTVVKNQGFVIFSSSRLRSSNGDPFGLHFWEPFGLQMAPTWLPELPRRPQDHPGSLQEASYTPPTFDLKFGPEAPKRCTTALQELPRALQEPKMPDCGARVEGPWGRVRGYREAYTISLIKTRGIPQVEKIPREFLWESNKKRISKFVGFSKNFQKCQK